jgi:transposase
MVTDGQSAVLEALVEVCRPPAKAPPSNLRRTISAILWRHQNGTKWRSIPAELGPWSRAAQTFIRWARLGVWERLLDLVQQRGWPSAWSSSTAPMSAPIRRRRVPKGWGTTLRKERDRREALGRSRGGYGTKACVIADGRGRAVAFEVSSPGA